MAGREGGPDEYGPWADSSYWIPPWLMAPEQSGPEGLPPWMNKDRGANLRMAWMGSLLPWMQAYQQGNQWGQEFDWRKQMDLWSQGFQGDQFDWQKSMDQWSQGLQEQMFGWEQDQGLWGRGFQEQQLEWQKELEAQRLEADREAANLQAFGRRWKPNTRWT